jgi:TonB-linked SusC/RagA family outer membrane protein
MYHFYPKKYGQPSTRGSLHKILLVMKLTTLILITVILHVSAATFAQKVTLVEKNAPLTDVFQQIRKQTGYDFLFTGSDLKNAKPVTINVKNEELKDALTQIFEGQPIDFTIEDKTVVIKEKEPTLIDKAKAYFAQVNIKGIVTDETGKPLPGVTVKEKGTNNATATDQNGFYTLSVVNDKSIVTFSFIGFETQDFAVKDITNGSIIKLKATETNLKEVVVSKGYYDEKRELLTGNVSVVSSKVIGEQPVSDPILTLEGRVAGLQISQTSGIPGASYTVRLRGQNSLVNGNNPLYIVDGVPFNPVSLSSNALGGGALPAGNGIGYTTSGGLSPFNNLNPSDIEKIEVLKDADATAIYGSRGANGVILITTKKGQAGQTRVDLDLNSGIGQVAHTIPFLNTQQYLAMRHEAFKNDGVLPSSSDYDVNGTWDTTRYTNWQKVLTGNTAHFTNASLSLSGGNTNTQFLLGGNYSRQTMVYPGDFEDDKASVHVNLNHSSSNQKFHASFTAQYGEDRNVTPSTDIAYYATLAPDAPTLYNPDGSINFANGTFYNPLIATLQKDQAVASNLLSNLVMSYEILSGLRIQSSFGYNHMEMNQTNLLPASSFYGPPVATKRENDIATGTTNTWLVEPQINYKRKISHGNLEVLIGTTVQRNTYNATTFYTYGYSSDVLIKNIANASTVSVGDNTYADYKANGVYGRINYAWEEKYVINATARRDGSSRFGPGAQFGNFGAVGAAWIFTKEKLIENALPYLSFGKLRLSYGTTGNDQIAPYQYLSSYSTSGNYQNTSGLSPSRIANPYYAWELDKKLEGGLDLGFLNDRILLNVDYYRNRTGNQLVNQALPAQDGFSAILANLPAVVQNAGLEIELNTVNIKGGNFSWTTSVNFSRSRNKLISFPGLALNPTYVGSFEIGQPINPRLYHFTGINPQTGLPTVQDTNGDGVLNNSDKGIVKPTAVNYFGGISNSFAYKGIQLDVFFQYVKQTGQNALKALGGSGGSFNLNEPTLILERWQNPSDVTNIPRFRTGASPAGLTAYSNAAQSDFYITDASFIRLKNIALSYAVPKGWQRYLGLQNARIYMQAQNLITITSYKGFDPETQGTALPPLLMFSLGIHASL